MSAYDGEPMRRAVIAIAGLIAAAGLGALAASGIAGGEAGPPEPIEIEADRELGPLAVERVNGPGPEARANVRGRGGKSQQLAFFQTTEPLEIAPQSEEGATLACPKGYKALGGYYVTGRQGTFLGLTAPQTAIPPQPDGAKRSKRNWVLAVYNSTGEPDQVDFGVGCLEKK